MATDATGALTSLGIPTYNVDADAPSGLGLNAIVASINTKLQARTGNLALTDAAATITFGGDSSIFRGAASEIRADAFFIPVRSSGYYSLGAKVTGDTGTARWAVKTTGVLIWADGTNAEDTNLYRNGANSLKTDGEIRINLDLIVALNNTSKIYFGSALDTNVYRSGAGLLKTDGDFWAAGTLIVTGHFRSGDVQGSNTNLVQATKKLAVYDTNNTLQGYLQLYTG
jgi:hypothetical protein